MPSESMETRISHVFENGPYTSRILIFQTFGTWAIFKKVTTLTRVKLGNRNVLKRIFFHLHQKPTYERALKTRWSIFAAFFHFSHTMLYWGGLFNALNIKKSQHFLRWNMHQTLFKTHSLYFTFYKEHSVRPFPIGK